MSIHIKENPKPKLKKCEMICDVPLDEKLNKYDVTSFLNEHTTTCFIGKPRSGKTSLLYSFFKSKEIFNKTFHNVFLFQPSESARSMKDNIFEEIPDEQRFDELTYENLEYVMDFIKSEDCQFNSCIIFDDVGSQLKNKETMKLLKQLIQNRRHLHCSCVFLTQTWYSNPKEIRKLFSNLFIFKVSIDELRTIAGEMIASKKKYIDEIYDIVFTRPYKFLFINTDTQRLFDDFDEIIIS
tara:strand:- start:127 stop:843 length:717 start_codon:yes stop_codon:yes gene_type:complete